MNLTSRLLLSLYNNGNGIVCDYDVAISLKHTA